MIRFWVRLCPDLHLPMLGLTHVPMLLPALRDLFTAMGFAPDGEGRRSIGNRFTGPVPGIDLEPELFARGCWALTLLTELFRVGETPGSPLATLDLRRASADQLLAAAPSEAVTEFVALRRHAEQVLLPPLATRCGQWALAGIYGRQ